MSREQRILRIPRSDVEDGSFVLVNAAKKSTHPLDVKLLGTEGFNAYSASIKQSRLRQLRANNWDGTDQEWEAALTFLLLQEQHEGHVVQEREKLEVVASLPDADHMSIIIRKNISGIAQRMGTISLKQSEDEIQLFDWCALTAQASGERLQQISTLKADNDAQQQTISKLKDQLQELITAKQEHENVLLQKFSDLLNSKKLKIRDQQRLLAGAKVDPVAAEQVQSARQSIRARKAGPSRTSKRKSPVTAPVEEDSESDAFEQDERMQVDSKSGEAKVAEEQTEEEGEEEAGTPEKSDLDETEDEADPDAAEQLRQPRIGAIGKAIESTTRQKQAPATEEPPPRRELPFQRSARETRAPQVPPEPEPDDEETEDEEL